MSDEIVSKSVQKVHSILTQHGIGSKIVEFSASTRTAQQAADQIGCSIAQIVKSIIFCTEQTNQPVLVLTSGINRVNEKIIEQSVGEKLKKADADFVRMVTGFAIGGVPPVAHAQKITTFIDKNLLQYEQLWAAAGTPHTVFCLTPTELTNISQGKIISVQ